MPIAASQLAYLPQKDERALMDWLREHGDMHKRIQQRAVNDGHLDLGTYNVYDMAERDDWLYFHNQEHVEIASTYHLGAPPDLSYWDFDEPVTFNNWLAAHSLVHDNENRILGLR